MMDRSVSQAEADRTVAPLYWTLPTPQLLRDLHSSWEGLRNLEAERRLDQTGPNLISASSNASAFGLLFRQFQSPLVLILVFVATLSAVPHSLRTCTIADAIDAKPNRFDILVCDRGRTCQAAFLLAS